jgi:Rha family phage regulatory protein
MSDLILSDGGNLWTTSGLVADKFGKHHNNVLRAIVNLECSPQFNQLNFKPVEYRDAKGERRPMFRISRDGFSFLAMGFTGKEAGQWKERFISAFNAMERTLRNHSALHADPDWQKVRGNGKVVRRELTDAVQEFVGYAAAQGSKSAEKYYMSITTMENRALFLVGQALGKKFRDSLTTRQCSYLTAAEAIAQKAIREGMSQEMHYKDIYQLAKRRVGSYSALLGQTFPGDDRPMLPMPVATQRIAQPPA